MLYCIIARVFLFDFETCQALGKSYEHLRTSSLVLKMFGATKRYVRCITLGKMEAAKEAAGNDES